MEEINNEEKRKQKEEEKNKWWRRERKREGKSVNYVLLLLRVNACEKWEMLIIKLDKKWC